MVGKLASISASHCVQSLRTSAGHTSRAQRCSERRASRSLPSERCCCALSAAVTHATFSSARAALVATIHAVAAKPIAAEVRTQGEYQLREQFSL